MGGLRIGIAAVLLTLLGGCGQPRSQVHGTVRYQGKPLTAGTIVFLAADNQTYPIKIRSDGTYQVALPRGRVRVGVQAAQPRPPARPQPGAKGSDDIAANAVKMDDAAKGRHKTLSADPTVKVPPHYTDPDQSGLTFDLQSPDQEYSIDLK